MGKIVAKSKLPVCPKGSMTQQICVYGRMEESVFQGFKNHVEGETSVKQLNN